MKEKLIENRNALVMQRAMLKDQLEANEKALAQVAFAIQALEAVEAEQKAKAEVTED